MKIDKLFGYEYEPTDTPEGAAYFENGQFYRLKSKVHYGWRVNLEDRDELFLALGNAHYAEPTNYSAAVYPSQKAKQNKLWEPVNEKLVKLLKLKQLLPFSYCLDKKVISFAHL